MDEDKIFAEDCVESDTDVVPSDADEDQPPLAALPDASQCELLNQLEQLRAVAIARMECYKKAPTKKAGALWQESELNKLYLVSICIALDSFGKILDTKSGKWIYCGICKKTVLCKEFSATQFVGHKCCTSITERASKSVAQTQPAAPAKSSLQHYFRGIKRAASNQSISSQGSAAMPEDGLLLSQCSEASQQSDRSQPATVPVIESVETHGADRCMGVPLVNFAKFITLPPDLAFILPVPMGKCDPPVEVFAEAVNVVMDLYQHRDLFQVDNIDYGPFIGRSLKAKPSCSGVYTIALPKNKSPFDKDWVICAACNRLTIHVRNVFNQGNLKGNYGMFCKAVWAKLILASIFFDNAIATDYLNKVVQDNSLRLKDTEAWRKLQEVCKDRGKFSNWLLRVGHSGVEISSIAKDLGKSPEDTLLMRFSQILKNPDYAKEKENVIVGLVDSLCS